MKDPQYTTVMLAAAMFFLISIIIHFPFANSPSYYSDFVDSFWGRTVTPQGPLEVVTGIPYVTYMFEYPPICWLILWLGGWASGGNEAIFCVVEFGVLFVFSVLTAHVVYNFLGHLGLSYNRQLIYSIFAPSLIFYGAYNFDVVQTFFVTLSLYLFIAKSKFKMSALMLGLAIGTKLSPVLLLPILLQEISNDKDRARFTMITGGVVGALNVPFMIANYNLWLQGYVFLKTWGLEDSFLIWIFRDPFSYIAKDLSYAFLIAAVLSIYVFFRSKPVLVRSFMALSVFILFSYIATPQMNIDLLPLFALVPMIPLTLFYLFEISNAAIILSWFEFPNPTLPGVSQTFALIRQIYLAFIIVILGFSNKTTES
ncbi:MAG: hypothetical protein ACREBS_08610 [Nitrososphaerales archaeon]